jgi:ribose transport system substrate-binding protein
MKKIIMLMVFLVVIAALAMAGGKGEEAKGVKIALSNSILSNSWRTQMVKIFEAYCENLKDEGIVSEYYATSTGNSDANDQVNEVRNLIAAGYDIIVIDCASDALSVVIKEAAAEGIIVVTFDNIVETDVSYSITVNATKFAIGQVEWLVNELGGKGKIFLIKGMDGASDDTRRNAAYMSVLKKYPDIKIIGEGNGNWDYGTTAELMNNLLAANGGKAPDGILMQGMGEVAVVEALINYGIDPASVPFTGEWTNGYFRVIMEHHLNCYVTGVPAYLSAMAVDIGLAVYNGEKVERNQVIDPPVIDAADAADWYYPDQPDEFVSAFTDADNTWNLTVEDMK